MKRRWPSTAGTLLLRLLVGIALVNAPFWLLGRYLFLDRPVVTYESLLVCLMMAWQPTLGWPVLALAWAADAVTSVSRIYFFTSPRALMQATAFLRELRVTDFVDPLRLGVALLFAVCSLLLWWLMRHRSLGRIAPLLALAALFAADTLNGSGGVSQRAERIVTANLVGSPVVNLVVSVAQAREAQALVALPSGASAADAGGVLAWTQAHPSDRVLMVLVESMGAHRDPALQAWLSGRLVTALPRGRYTVREQRVPFLGNTTTGELRTLCSLADDYRLLDAAAGAGCLPARLAGAGWETIAFHGFSGNMFARRDWWPHAGFGRVLFAEEMLRPDAPRCGLVFRGACDADVIDSAMAELQPQRRFVYVLTLNTHLPLPRTEVPADLRRLCERAGTGDTVCQLLAAHGALLRHLGQALARTPVAPLVVVAGDHAPPFSLRGERDQFSRQAVPVFVLEPL